MSINKIRVALYMHRMSIPDKINKAKHVKLAITGNATVFASPGAVITNLTNAITALDTAWNTAQDGGKTLTALMHDRENDLDVAMMRVAAYVETIANGNADIIHLAGLDVRPNPVLPVNAAFEVKHGEGSGQVILKVKAVTHASYLWQYSTDQVNWVDAGPGIQSRKQLRGLTPGTRYWFRVAVVDKEGQQSWSEAISLIVV